MDFDDNQEENYGQGSPNPMEDFFLPEDETSAQYKSMKDCVIFLLDCNKSMIENNAINNVLMVAESFLKTKIITNEKDIFGLILYNTEITLNNFNFPGINIKIALSPPDAAIIKNIKELQQMSNPNYNKNYLQTIKSLFPPSDIETSLGSALTVCHSELKNFDEKTHNKRIFLFTDNDNPMISDATQRSITIQRAKDMLESDIIIELFPMHCSGGSTENFNMRKFYVDIIPKPEDINSDLILTQETCTNRIRELTKRIRQKEVKKRRLGSCNFFLTSQVKINVDFYAVLKRTSKPRSFNVDARTNKTLNTITQMICKETGGILYQNQIATFQTYGGVKVPFTKEEMKQIKTIDEPGIKLMGFKNFDSIKPYFNIRESYFVYPDDNLTHGASQLCDALIKQMKSKSKVAIVKFIPRDGANVRFCALLPQTEAFDEDYFQTPPGFNLIFLPFADEIRSSSEILVKKNVENLADEINNHQLEIAKKLIKRTNIDFDSRNFENPTIQKFYATLQALALGEHDIEKVEDYINPDYQSLDIVLNKCDEDFKKSFYESGNNSVKNSKTTNNVNKRSATQGDDKGGKRKKVKSEDEDDENGKTGKKSKSTSKNSSKSKSKGKGKKSKSKSKKKVKKEDDEYSVDNLFALLQNGSLGKKTSKELKEICLLKRIKVATKSNKEDLLSALQEYTLNYIIK